MFHNRLKFVFIAALNVTILLVNYTFAIQMDDEHGAIDILSEPYGHHINLLPLVY